MWIRIRTYPHYVRPLGSKKATKPNKFFNIFHVNLKHIFLSGLVLLRIWIRMGADADLGSFFEFKRMRIHITGRGANEIGSPGTIQTLWKIIQKFNYFILLNLYNLPRQCFGSGLRGSSGSGIRIHGLKKRCKMLNHLKIILHFKTWYLLIDFFWRENLIIKKWFYINCRQC